MRALWLAPFGGGRRLLAEAEVRVGVPAATLRLYGTDDDLSTAGKEAVGSAAVSFLLVPDGPGRRGRLEAVVARLGAGGTLVVLDHNAPRGVLARALATVHLATARPLLGAAASRLRRPAARELDALGLEVVRLRLLAGELFQAILARKPAPK